jgi:hypothetical protein
MGCCLDGFQTYHAFWKSFDTSCLTLQISFFILLTYIHFQGDGNLEQVLRTLKDHGKVAFSLVMRTLHRSCRHWIRPVNICTDHPNLAQAMRTLHKFMPVLHPSCVLCTENVNFAQVLWIKRNLQKLLAMHRWHVSELCVDHTKFHQTCKLCTYFEIFAQDIFSLRRFCDRAM